MPSSKYGAAAVYRYGSAEVSWDWWTRGHVTAILTSDWPQVVRPLWHEFPRDAATLDIDDAFMWGGGLVIAPVISPATDTRTLYLPPGAR